MKTLLVFLSLLLALNVARASSASSPSTTTQSITVPGDSYVLNFGITWACDDYPQNSAPGRIELLNSSGSVVARVVASVYRPNNISVSVTGSGSVTNTNAWVAIYAPNGTPADAEMSGTWNITGLAPGNYTLKFYNYTTWETTLNATTVWTNTFSNGGYAPQPKQPPTIAWTSSPGTVASGQGYTISAHGHDGDGNMTAVSIWKNGQPFAFAGGGNGTDGDSQNPTSDAGPTTITFTAQAFDADGQSSAVITQTVTVNAPNQPPTIAWTSSPGTVASGQSYTISAHGHDANGNMTAVSIWKNGQPFAFAGGGNGTDGDSQNPTSDTGPTTITFTAQAFDASGASSAVITQTVTITAPNHAPTIAWNSTPGTVPSGQSYTISAHGYDQDGNLAQVNVWRNGQPYAFAGGGNGYDGDSGNPSTDTGPQTITYTAQAVDAKGAASATISQTVTISAPPPVNHAPTIAWTSAPGTVSNAQSYTVAAHGHDQDSNLSQVRIWKNGQPFTTTAVSGADGDSSGNSADTGPQTITFTAQAFDSSGASSATISQTVTVNAPPPAQYTLTTSAGAGGSVSAGGTYTTGTVLTITATPDALHDFAGWSGDAGGTANPLSVTLDRNKSVQANFTSKMFALATSTSGGGAVTPGGSYPAGSWVTISASPDGTHVFNGWAGDASGTAPSVAVYLDRPKSVQAVFGSKASQTISFVPPGDHATSAPPFVLNASASSGLPVVFTILSGPATLAANMVQVTGAGPVTIQASQLGDATYLAAAPVTQTFNAFAPVSLKYRPAPRVFLNSEQARGTAPLIIEKP